MHISRTPTSITKARLQSGQAAPALAEATLQHAISFLKKRLRKIQSLLFMLNGKALARSQAKRSVQFATSGYAYELQ
jgi:hypothetical protein